MPKEPGQAGSSEEKKENQEEQKSEEGGESEDAEQDMEAEDKNGGGTMKNDEKVWVPGQGDVDIKDVIGDDNHYNEEVSRMDDMMDNLTDEERRLIQDYLGIYGTSN